MKSNIPIPASVYIITLNAADRLSQLLSQLRNFDEVIIVDCGSTDQTRDIASRYANVDFSHHDWVSFSDQKAYALSKCRNEWVLNLDADEELTQELIEAIRNTIRGNDCDALKSRRMVYRWGKRSPYFTKDSQQIRFFRKRCGHYEPRRVHERISIAGTVHSTRATIIHHQDMTFDELETKLNRYSQLKAEDKFEQGSRANFLVLLFVFPLTFIQHYLFKGFCLGGVEGLVGSVNIAFYNFMKYAKLWEMEHSGAAGSNHFPTTNHDSTPYLEWKAGEGKIR